ncbi:MAG: oligosaccharide flippase family protein [Acidobacteriota bacterium]|nr:oligosaccharide flippase family protein [Acidobacteriota bacterium]MDH3784996.1 oligosaccharide flippase family protein [Acidobacteriota bacterium]
MAETLLKRLLAGGAWALAGKFVTAGSELLALGLLARLLSDDHFGAYMLAYTTITGGAMLAQVGLHMAVVRFVAEFIGTGRPEKARRVVVRCAQLLFVGCLVIGSILAFGGGSWLARSVWNSSTLAAAMGAVAIWAVLRAIQVFVSEAFRGLKDIRLATVFGGTIARVLFLALLFYVSHTSGSLQLIDAVYMISAATAFSLLISVTLLAIRISRLPVGGTMGVREILGVSTPMWVTGLTALVLTQFDLWVMGAFFSEDQVGVYGAAARLVTVVSMSLTLVNLVVPPFIADLYARGEREQLQRVLRATATFAGLPAFLVLATFIFAGGTVLSLVYEPRFAEGATILALLSAGRLVNVLTGSCGITLGMTGHQRYLMGITLVVGVGMVTSALLVRDHYGTVGIATVACVGIIVHNLAMWLTTRWVAGLWTHVGIPRPHEMRTLYGRIVGRR